MSLLKKANATKLFVIAALLFAVTLKSEAQTITIDNARFDALNAGGVFGDSSTITVPIHLNGCFGTITPSGISPNDSFQLWISKSNFLLDSQLIGGFKSHFTTFINGIIPAGYGAGPCNVKVSATTPAVSSASNTTPFLVSAILPGSSAASIAKANTDTSTILRSQLYFGWCQSIAPVGSKAIPPLVMKNLSVHTGGSDSAFYYNELSGSNTSFNIGVNGGSFNVPITQSYFTLSIKSVSALGALSTFGYNVINAKNNLTPSNVGGGTVKACAKTDSAKYNILIDTLVGSTVLPGIGFNFPGNLYTVNWGDNTTDYFRQCDLLSTGGDVEHLYTTSNCPFSYSVKFTLLNPFYVQGAINQLAQCDNPTQTLQASIFAIANAKFLRDSIVCMKDTISFFNQSDPGQGEFVTAGTTCGGAAKYQWYVSDLAGVFPATPDSNFNDQALVPQLANFRWKFSGPGTYLVKLVTNNGTVCSVDSVIHEVCIEDSVHAPDVSWIYDTLGGLNVYSGCVNNLKLKSTNLYSGCNLTKYHWELLTNPGKLPVNPVLVNYQFSTPDTAISTISIGRSDSFYIRLNITNSCTRDTVKLDKVIYSQGAPLAKFPKDTIAYCSITNVNQIDFSSNANHKPVYSLNPGGGGTQIYAWTVTKPPTNPGASYQYVLGTDSTNRYPTIKFTGYGKWVVAVSYTNDCGTSPNIQTIFYNPPTTVTAKVGNKYDTICYSILNYALNGFTAGGPTDSTRWSTIPVTGSFGDNTSLNTTFIPTNKTINTKIILTAYPAYYANYPLPLVLQPGCGIKKDTIFLSYRPRNTGTDTTIKSCSGDSIKNIYTPVSSAAGSLFIWTVTQTFGAPGCYTNNNVPKPYITDAPCGTGVITYSVTPVLNGCFGTPFKVIVGLIPKPLLSIVYPNPADTTVCSNVPFGIQPTTNLTNVHYDWTHSFTSPQLTTIPSGPATNQSGNVLFSMTGNDGSNFVQCDTLRIKAVDSVGCRSLPQQVIVCVNPGATAPIAATWSNRDTILCNQTTFQLHANKAIVGTGHWVQLTGFLPSPWTIVPNVVPDTDPGAQDAIMNNMITGTYIFAWEITGGICPGAADYLTIYNRPPATTAKATFGTDTAICNYVTGTQNIQLNANALDPTRPWETGKWSLIRPVGSNGQISDVNIPNPIFSYDQIGTYTLIWTIKNDAEGAATPCSQSVDSFHVRVFKSPTKGVITSSGIKAAAGTFSTPAKYLVCVNSTVTDTLSGYYGNIRKWQTDELPFNVWDDSLSATNPIFTINAIQDSMYVQAIVESYGAAFGCTNTDTAKYILIRVSDSSTKGFVSPKIVSICGGVNSGSITLTPHVADTIKWTSSTDGGVTWNQLTYPFPAWVLPYSGVSKITHFRAESITGACPGVYSDTAIINISTFTTPAIVGNPDTVRLCQQDTLALFGNSPIVPEVGTWTSAFTPGGGGAPPTFDNPNSPNTVVRGLVAGFNYNFVWTISNICPSQSDSVWVGVAPVANNTINNLSIQTICYGDVVTIQGFGPVGGVPPYFYQWQDSSKNSGGAWVNISSTTYPSAATITLTYKPTDTVWIRRILIYGVCNIASNVAQVYVQPKIGNNAISLINPLVCINTSPGTINGTVPTGGDGTYTYSWESSLDSVNWVSTGVTTQNYTPGVLTDTIWYRRIVSSGKCVGILGDTSAVLSVYIIQDAKAKFVFTDTIFCPPIDLKTKITNTAFVGNITYNWYANPQVNTVYSNIGSGFIMPSYAMAVGPDSVRIKLVVDAANGCKSDSMTQVFVTQPSSLAAFTANKTSLCSTDSIVLTNTTPSTNLFTYLWYVDANLVSNAINPPNQQFAPSGNGSDTFYVVKLRRISSCDTSDAQQIITVRTKPKALFTVNPTYACTGKPVTFNNSSNGGDTYDWDFGDGATFTTNSKVAITHNYTTATLQYFTVKLVVTNPCGKDSTTFNLLVAPNVLQLNFAIASNEKTGCANHTVNIQNSSSGATNFVWDFDFPNGALISSGVNVGIVSYTYTTPGVKVIKVYASNGCNDTTAFDSVKVFAKPIATFTANDTICLGNNVSLNNTTSPAAISNVWDFGTVCSPTPAGSNQPNPPSLTYGVVGTDTIRLVTSNTYLPSGPFPAVTCTDSTKRPIVVVAVQNGTFTASSTVSTCVPFSVDFTNTTVPAGGTVVWDFKDNKPTGLGNAITHVFDSVGVYDVTMTITNPGGCTYTAVKRITVNGPSGKLSYTGGYVCGNSPVTFTVLGAQNVSVYDWDFQDNFPVANTTTNPIVHSFDPTACGSHIPTVKLTYNLNPACIVTLKGVDTIKVDYLKAGYKVNTQTYCDSTKITFIDTSAQCLGIASWSWNFGVSGAGNTSNLQNPSYTYTTTNTYAPILSIVGNSGCTDTWSGPVNVKVNNRPDIVDIGRPVPPLTDVVCGNSAIPFVANVQSTDAIATYSWYFGNGTQTNGQSVSNLFAAASSATNYNDTLIVGTIFGCYDTLVQPITIQPSPIITVNPRPSITICIGTSTPLTASSSLAAPTTYSWSPITGLSNSNTNSTSASPNATTQYVVTGTLANGCFGTDTVNVLIQQPMNLDIPALAKPNLCIVNQQLANLDSTLIYATGATNYTWTSNPPDTNMSSHTGSPIQVKPSSTTTYTVSSTDNCGTQTKSVVVNVGFFPFRDTTFPYRHGPDTIIGVSGTIVGMNTQFLNGPIASYDWTPVTNLTCNTCQNPSVHVQDNITYYVTATNVAGCKGYDTVYIQAQCSGSNVYIPNAFTPDGDGKNDIFLVRATGIKLVKSFRIFNRWGQVVFERSNFAPNDRQYGWNGLIGTNIAPTDIYVYVCEVVCDTNVPYKIKGNVAVLK